MVGSKVRIICGEFSGQIGYILAIVHGAIKPILVKVCGDLRPFRPEEIVVI